MLRFQNGLNLLWRYCAIKCECIWTNMRREASLFPGGGAWCDSSPSVCSYPDSSFWTSSSGSCCTIVDKISSPPPPSNSQKVLSPQSYQHTVGFLKSLSRSRTKDSTVREGRSCLYLGLEGMLWGGRRAVVVAASTGMAWSRGMLGVVAVTRAVGVSREMGVEALSVGPAGRKHLATGIHINPWMFPCHFLLLFWIQEHSFRNTCSRI